MWVRLRRLLWITFAGVFGLVAGCLSAGQHIMPKSVNYPFLAQKIPLPHHVPPHAGGTSFRFAMAHDVIHERYPKHGPAYHWERERITRKKLAAAIPDSPDWFALNDDLAASLERLGRSDEAIAVIRKKLARQQARGFGESELYTSYANLGTFLMHESSPTMHGNPAARERFREGLELVKKGVAVNPAAHFNRERWEVEYGEFLLRSSESPDTLTKVDCLGNRLDVRVEEILNREENWVHIGYGRPTDPQWSQGMAEFDVRAYFSPDVKPDDPAQWNTLSPIRKHITMIGGDTQRGKEPVPFDEPMLGIVGLWRQGGGANPHFALAIGETMLRVGQRYIAWTAFERAYRLAVQFSPDPAIQEFLRDHCRKRQADITKSLSDGSRGVDRRAAMEAIQLRSQFEAELAYGESYQKEYQEYEERKIAAGVPIGDEHFFDEFHAGREPIASRVGEEEWYSWVPRRKMYEYAEWRAWSSGIFGAGVGAMLMAGLIRWRSRQRTATPT